VVIVIRLNMLLISKDLTSEELESIARHQDTS
jgi:hypothetical protein